MNKEELMEYEEWKANIRKDEAHQAKIYKMIHDFKQKELNYRKECIIKNKLIYPKNNNNFDVDFID